MGSHIVVTTLAAVSLRLPSLQRPHHSSAGVGNELSSLEPVSGDASPPTDELRPPGFEAVRPAEGVPEGPAELEGHDVVEDGVDDGGDVVEDPGDVEEHGVEQRRLGPVGVDDEEALEVERSPAEEERHDHRHWRRATGQRTTNAQPLQSNISYIRL